MHDRSELIIFGGMSAAEEEEWSPHRLSECKVWQWAWHQHPGCAPSLCLMRYWLPIESMDFWFGSMEVVRIGSCTLERAEDRSTKGEESTEVQLLFNLPLSSVIVFFFFASDSYEIIVYYWGCLSLMIFDT